MRSNLFAALGVGMLLAVVFGVTLIGQYAGGPAVEPARTAAPEALGGVPLLFAKTELYYDPTSDDLEKRHFQGFYEVTDRPLTVDFWFRNPHRQPVTLTVRGRSCSACTSANVAVVPAEAARRFELAAAAPHLSVGPSPVPDLLAALAHAALMRSLEWRPLDFEQPENGVTIPAAPDDATPTWGVFQVVIKVTGVGPKQLRAEAGMTLPGSPTVRQVFAVGTVGVASLDVSPKKLDFGEFPEGSSAREAELICWSSTREQADLPPPTLNVSVKDPFLRLGTPVPLTAAERERVPSDKNAPPMRVKSGYRVPVTLVRRVPAAESSTGAVAQPDVGPYERQIGVAGTGAAVVSIPVTATVTGVVGLVEGGVIDLKDFNGRAGVERTATIVSDRADLALELLPAECVPAFVRMSLSEPKAENGRRYWTITLVVPPDACQADLPAGSAVALRGRSGGEEIKVKLPVKGRGFVRGR